MIDSASRDYIYISCGYDLLACAVTTILTDIGLQSQSIPMMHLMNGKIVAPQVLIIDNAASNQHSTEIALLKIEDLFPATSIILLDSDLNPHRILLAYNLGIEGYFYLGDQLIPRFNRAIIDILDGGTYYSPSITAALINARHLTENIFPRLNEYHYGVLQGMADHLTGTKIAERLDRSTHAIYQVQRYLRGLFRVETNSELLDAALSWGIIQRP